MKPSATPGIYDFMSSIPTTAPTPAPTDWNSRTPISNISASVTPSANFSNYEALPTNHFSLDYTVILAIFLVCITLVLITWIIKKK